MTLLDQRRFGEGLGGILPLAVEDPFLKPSLTEMGRYNIAEWYPEPWEYPWGYPGQEDEERPKVEPPEKPLYPAEVTPLTDYVILTGLILLALFLAKRM